MKVNPSTVACASSHLRHRQPHRQGQAHSLVEHMLALHQQLAEARTHQAGTMLQRQIEATDRQIDRLVYGLYGLTDEEIEIMVGER